MERYGLGIDIGGTFTDIVLYEAVTGAQRDFKILTTHADPAEGVMAGIREVLARTGVLASSIVRVVHATTLFTNALIERKGATTGLITTRGFRDVLEIGRERKFELYDLGIIRTPPLVPRRLRQEVPERVTAAGRIETPLDVAALDDLSDRLVGAGATSLAIVFLHSYANPANEAAARDRVLHRHPGIAVSASIDVAPEIREYERTSTTVCNAYVKPLADLYLSSLERRLAEAGIAAPLMLMLSNGGLTNVADAKRNPVQLLESGPAAGALVAAHFASIDDSPHVLAFDMGGTTAKLSMIENGRPSLAYAFEAARQKRFVEGSGLPVRISTVELIEIGAGGGSIAALDVIGLLKVGPESAGSEPGPACYGLGGTKPTVTDADMLLGYLNPDYFAGGELAIDRLAIDAALAPLAGEARLEPTELAWGIHDLVNENMANAARVHIAEHGKDPRRYALLCTGGAGPVHAYHVALKLGITRIITPPSAGVASALGLLVAPARVDRMTTVALDLARIDWADLEARFVALERDAAAVLRETGLDAGKARTERFADIRYAGQASELVVALPAGPYDAASRPGIVAAFETSYREAFTRTPPSQEVEIINIRVASTLQIEGTIDDARPAGADAVREAQSNVRQVYFRECGGFTDVPVVHRAGLRAGDTGTGPAVIEEAGSTLVIGPRGRFVVAANGSIITTIANKA